MKQFIYSSLIALLIILTITVAFDTVERQSGKIKQMELFGRDHTSTDVPKLSTDVFGHTKAIMTINSFEKGGSGGGPSECDGKYHSDKTLIVALSTRWFNNMKRCFKYITIYANGRSVNAMVVDECDSTRGCAHNIVDASEAVWKALGIPKKDWGWLEVFWADA